MTEIYGIDFGGTNLRIGRVESDTGEIRGNVYTKDISRINSNKELTDIVTSQLPSSGRIGISAAGDVDESKKIINQSPNSRIQGGISFGKELEESGHDVCMTNDLKAAVQAAYMYDEGCRDSMNVLLATYSSGYNCGVVRNGVNQGSPEFGHMPYGPSGDLFCSCGEKGHIEPYVSGNGAAAMAKQFFLSNRISDHQILQMALEDFNNSSPKEEPQHPRIVDTIEAKHVYRAFSSNPDEEPQKSIQDTQFRAIAHSFGMMNSAYNPLDVMVLMGSQTKDWENLFEPAIDHYKEGGFQLPSLNTPQIFRTKLQEIGVQGAAAYFSSQKEERIN